MKSLNYLMFFAAIAAAIYIGSEMTEFDLLSQALLLAPCFYLLYVARASIGKYKSYYIFSLFYTLGYVIYLYVMHLTRDEYTIGGWMGIGNFDFRKEQLNALSYSAFALMVGLFLGSSIFAVASKTRLPCINRGSIALNRGRLNNYINIWISFGLLLILFMATLGLGRTGLQDSTTLPFGIKGFMFYARVLLLPLIGFYLLELSTISGDSLLFHKVMKWILIFAVLIAILFFSRSDLVIFLLPLVAYLATHTDPSIRSHTKRFFIKVFFVVVIGTQIVQIGRNFFYSDSSADINLNDIFGVFEYLDLQSVVNNLITLATIRQGGARDMAVALNSDYTSISYVWNFFWQIDEVGFMTDVWGFDLDAFDQEGKSYGTGFNGFGWYAFGGSYFLIFTLSFVTGMFSCWIERVFEKRNLIAAQYFIAFSIAIMLWNSFVWGRAWRVVPMILLAAFIMDRMDKNIFKRRKQFKISQSINPSNTEAYK